MINQQVKHPTAWSQTTNAFYRKYIRKHFDYLASGHLIRTKGKSCVGRALKGCNHKSGYLIIAINGRSINYHVAIWLFHYDYRPRSIDHINGIKHDNRIENLRAATVAQNTWNQSKQTRNTTGHKGLFWCKNDKLWYGAVQCNGNRKKIGWSKDKTHTLKELVKYRKKVHGEFFK